MGIEFYYPNTRRFKNEREYYQESFDRKYQEILSDADQNLRTKIFQLIVNERARQDYLHPNFPEHKRLPVLVEEHGEIGKAIFEEDFEELKKELVQNMAVCFRWLEEIL